MYSLEDLKELFLEHGTQSEEEKAKMIRRFQEMNPGDPLPPHMTEPFNLCFALYAMCDEVERLKNSVR